MSQRDNRLGEIILHLRLIQSAIVVSVAALKHQNCELDDDVAGVLQRSVADRLQDQIEQLESLTGSASTTRRRNRKTSRKTRPSSRANRSPAPSDAGRKQ